MTFPAVEPAPGTLRAFGYAADRSRYVFCSDTCRQAWLDAVSWNRARRTSHWQRVEVDDPVNYNDHAQPFPRRRCALCHTPLEGGWPADPECVAPRNTPAPWDRPGSPHRCHTSHGAPLQAGQECFHRTARQLRQGA